MQLPATGDATSTGIKQSETPYLWQILTSSGWSGTTRVVQQQAGVRLWRDPLQSILAATNARPIQSAFISFWMIRTRNACWSIINALVELDRPGHFMGISLILREQSCTMRRLGKPRDWTAPAKRCACPHQIDFMMLSGNQMELAVPPSQQKVHAMAIQSASMLVDIAEQQNEMEDIRASITIKAKHLTNARTYAWQMLRHVLSLLYTQMEDVICIKLIAIITMPPK